MMPGSLLPTPRDGPSAFLTGPFGHSYTACWGGAAWFWSTWDDSAHEGVIALPGVFCTYCGYDNPPTRGACVMCLHELAALGGGRSCPSCNTDNPRRARFCRSCGASLEPGVVAIPSRLELAAKVADAVGGVGVAGVGMVGGYEEEGVFGEPGEESMFSDMADAEEFAAVPEAPPAVVGKPPVGDLPPEAIPGPILEPAATQPPAAEIEPDEEFALPPPPGLVHEPASAGGLEPEEEDEFAPPPPPGVVTATAPAPSAAAGGLELDEEDFAPPPPPGAIAPSEPAVGLELDEESFAPPPPPGVVAAGTPGGIAVPDSSGVDEGLEWGLEEPDLPPPPPPPGVLEPEPASPVPLADSLPLSDEDFAPPPPPGVVTADDDIGPPPPPGVIQPEESSKKESKEAEDDFGAWELDFGEELK